MLIKNLLEGNIGENLSDFVVGIFFNWTKYNLWKKKINGTLSKLKTSTFLMRLIRKKSSHRLGENLAKHVLVKRFILKFHNMK